MPQNLVRFLPRLVLILTLVLATGCSFTRLGYQNLEWMINWKLRDYVSLNREQKRWLGAEIKNHHAWHCRSELPRYRAHLLALRDTALDPSIQAAELSQFVPIWEQEVSRTLRRMSPTLGTLLVSLEEDQIRGLEQNLARQNRDLHERYLAPSMDRQTRERSQRAQERIEAWLGRLTPTQRERVDLWAAELEGSAAVWLENREHWQHRFLELLKQRGQPGFEEAVEQLLLQPENYWTQAYRAQREKQAVRLSEMLAEILAIAEPRQRQHLERRADSLVQDLDNIRCASQT